MVVSDSFLDEDNGRNQLVGDGTTEERRRRRGRKVLEVWSLSEEEWIIYRILHNKLNKN